MLFAKLYIGMNYCLMITFTANMLSRNAKHRAVEENAKLENWKTLQQNEKTSEILSGKLDQIFVLG